jgi:hypothetical protein
MYWDQYMASISEPVYKPPHGARRLSSISASNSGNDLFYTRFDINAFYDISMLFCGKGFYASAETPLLL